MKGLVHSFEPFGTVDGPGIRLVTFLTGCPMQCSFCHNPEIAWTSDGSWLTPDDILAEFNKNRNFYTNGGITFSGGEPLRQAEFVYECAKRFKKERVHTALDTSLSCSEQWIRRLEEFVDLWMISIKAITPSLHQQLTARDNTRILKRIRDLNSRGVEMVIRYVIIPGLTDTNEELTKLGEFLDSLPHTPSVELLAYHTMGRVKWENMGLDYKLEQREATAHDINRAVEFLKKIGFQDVAA
jgi:pyruvate formate lyase activating enzyme